MELITISAVLSTVIALLLAFLVYQELAHARERATWARERQELIERAVPGVQIVERPSYEPKAFGSDDYEYEVEQARLKAGRS